MKNERDAKEGRCSKTKEHIMPPFVFCINMVFPGPPHYHLVMYFAVDDSSILRKESNGHKKRLNILHEFFLGSSDELRDKYLKLIPRVVEGSFLFRRAVGSKPVIMGRYLKTKYIRGERFLECVADLSSSPFTQKIIGLSNSSVSAKQIFQFYEKTNKQTKNI